jgi:hypothetical protein
MKKSFPGIDNDFSPAYIILLQQLADENYA